METLILKKANHLIHSTRVMTISVSRDNIPWSSPVYFVFCKGGFYFFSNETSRHIRYSEDKTRIAASIFHDSDKINDIFGFQMTGTLDLVVGKATYLAIVRQYITKFDFLQKTFGSQLLENRRFFLEKFKSRLYGFFPDKIFLSDNSKSSDKRQAFGLDFLKSM